MTEGRVPEACTKFEESQKIDAGLGTQFHLADCWQHLGRTAEASLGGGAAVLFVGAMVAASAPHPRIVMNAASLEITPVVGPRQGGLGLRGAW